ncbi:hypothetical protein LPYR103PRE_08300 [Segatella asaccharophila]|jgi:hypothetical protein
MTKELPIQLVKFRDEKDDHKTECPGQVLPPWVSDDAILRNGANIYNSLRNMQPLFLDRNHNQGLPILVTAKINNSATATSYRKAIDSLFDTSKKRNVIGMGKINNLLIKIDTSSDLSQMTQNASIYQNKLLSQNNKIAFSALTNIEKFKPNIDDNIIGNTVKIKLVDYVDYRLNLLRDEIFEKICKDINVEFIKANYAEGLTIYLIKDIQEQVLSKISTIDSVISVRKMPYVEFTAASEPEIADVIVKHPKQDVDYPIVGLLDSGVAKIEHLQDWIIPDNENLGGYLEEDINRAHGTAVAGTLAYGPELLGKKCCNVPFMIKDCIVNISEPISEFELIENIRQYIFANPNIKIWNLSQGLRNSANDSKFSDFAIFLDSIQKEQSILICKSAGNKDINSPGERINEGADSIRSIVVGSLDSCRSLHPNKISSFSKKGPGPEGTIKPDLISYGGDVPVFNKYGMVIPLNGTSFSTPRITALAESISYELGQNFSPLLVKALLIHGAEYPHEIDLKGKELLDKAGFGMPTDINKVLHNDKNEATMIFQFKLTKGNNIQSVDFPFPDSLSSDGYYYGQITVTLAVDPLLDPKEGTEYCQSEAVPALETCDRVDIVTPGDPDVPSYIRNSQRPVNTHNILNAGLYSKKNSLNTNTLYATERQLIFKNMKWAAIKKYKVNLSEMTLANKKKYLSTNRRWVLKINSHFREAAIKNAYTDGTELAQKAVFIVTIKDTKNKGVIYNECINQLTGKNYIHNNLTVQEDILVK